MSQHRVSRLLPYTCQQLYMLVLDIERYPEFVPGYRQARIVRHEVNALEVEQAVGFGPLGFRFRSRATYTAPSYIEVLASDGPFRRLEVRWEFAAEGAGGWANSPVGSALTGSSVQCRDSRNRAATAPHARKKVPEAAGSWKWPLLPIAAARRSPVHGRTRRRARTCPCTLA